MANPYSVLGVQKSADEKAIKSAFRKLAMKYHPDQNKDNKSAQAKFAEINQAYEILGDREKRAQFDRGEIDEEGKPKFAGFAGGNPFNGGAGPHGGNPFGGNAQGFGGAEDILSEIFGSAFGGQAQAQRGRAGGNPFAGMGGGQGGGMGGQPQHQRQTAPSLDLEMKAAITIEDLMRGKTTVRMPDGRQISVSIPPEAEHGQIVRLKGQGKKAPGRQAGAALVTLVMKSHPRFRRDGTDLRSDVPVPLETAILGGKVAVDTVDGKLSLNIPAGTSSGRIFRLKGKGLPKKAGGFGDLLVSSSIQLPESKDRLKQLVTLFENMTSGQE